jgi:hypothetical protein
MRLPALIITATLFALPCQQAFSTGWATASYNRGMQVPAVGQGGPLAFPASASSDYRHDSWGVHLQQNHPYIPQTAVQKVIRYLKERTPENNRYVTIIDFNLPSTAKRMYIISLEDGSVTPYLVAHGEGSGANMATKFSNEDGSHQSSLGLYLAAESGSGKKGTNLLLDGLESTNDLARDREILIHEAWYVSPEFIKKNGRLGRSHGCPAVEEGLIGEIIEKLEGGSVFLIHHGD